MNTAYQWTVSYEHFWSKKERLALSITAAKFEGNTFIKFSEGSFIARDGFPVIGVGFSGVDIKRFDVQFVYKSIRLSRSFYFNTNLGLGMQISKVNGYEFGNLEPPNGPDYFQLADITAQAYNTVQVVPVAGFKTGFLIWRRVDLGINVQGVLGFKSYQDLYFPYAYRGVEQETAVFEAKGTGIFSSLNLGWRFVKPKSGNAGRSRAK